MNLRFLFGEEERKVKPAVRGVGVGLSPPSVRPGPARTHPHAFCGPYRGPVRTEMRPADKKKNKTKKLLIELPGEFIQFFAGA